MTDNSKKAGLTLVTQPQEYFRELVTESMGRQNVVAAPETEFYLVNLLNQFMTTDRLYATDSEGGHKEEALVLLMKEALDTPEPTAQRAMFRYVGDVSLYFAGFFHERLSRKLVDLDYYVGMGGTAYKHVAAREEERSLRSTYLELADKFSDFVEVFADMSCKTAAKTEKDLLRIYDLWVRTKSDRAAKTLQEAGILTNPTTIKRSLQ